MDREESIIKQVEQIVLGINNKIHCGFCGKITQHGDPICCDEAERILLRMEGRKRHDDQTSHSTESS